MCQNKLMKKKTLLIIFILIACCVASNVVFAETGYIQQQLNAAVGMQGADFGQAKDPRSIITDVITIALGVLGVLFTAFIVYGGFLLALSRGEEEKITKGKKILQYGVIGILIIASATSLVLFIDRYMRAAQYDKNGGGPFYSEFEWGTDEDTSQFDNPDPLYEPPPGSGNAWKDMGFQD